MRLHFRPTPVFPGRHVLRLCRRLTSGLRRPSSFGGARGQLPASPGVASALPLRTSFRLSSNTASSGFTFGPTSNSSSAFGSFSLPSSQPSTRADHQPSSLAFRLDLRLAPAIASSGFPFGLNSDLRRNSCPPDLPSNPTSDSSSDIASLTLPSCQSPTFIGNQPSGSALRFDLRFSPDFASSGFPFAPSFRLAPKPASSGSVNNPAFVLDRSLNPPAVPSISNRLASVLNHSAVPATNFPASFDC